MQGSYRPSHHPIALIAPREEKQGEAALQRERVPCEREKATMARFPLEDKQPQQTTNNNNPAPATVTWYKCFFSPFSLSLPLCPHRRLCYSPECSSERERERRASHAPHHSPPQSSICVDLLFVFHLPITTVHPSITAAPCPWSWRGGKGWWHGLRERETCELLRHACQSPCILVQASLELPPGGKPPGTPFFSHPARVWAARQSAGCPHLGALTGTLSRCPPPAVSFSARAARLPRPLRSLPRLSPPAAAGLPTGTWERVFF